MSNIHTGKGNIFHGKKIVIHNLPQPTPEDNKLELQDTQDNDEQKFNNRKRVFIIHGHNEARWRELYDLLLEQKLFPVVLNMQPEDGKTVIEKFEFYASQCCFAFALFTYDDIVNQENSIYLQVRPNVIFELGWFYAKIGRENVMIIEQHTPNSMVFSDLKGIIRTQYYEKVEEVFKRIHNQLKSAGII